ncbi:pyridoxal phosphate-dependent transferase [Geopyxis carbonaria]|nr:pyridoxal phosphate-dependent transferase [Geopyxis carbonaria]
MSSLIPQLELAQQRYISANPASATAYNNRAQHLPAGNTRSILHNSPFPITFSTGASCYLRSADNKEYINFLGEYTAGLFGASNKQIHDAIRKALDGGLSLSGCTPQEAILARRICGRFGLGKIRFTNSGTEANMIAIAAARIATGRQTIMVFTGGYHGSTLSFPASGPPHALNLPHDFLVLPYNDTAALESALETLPESSLAAILVEPMLGAGGCIAGTVDFLRALRHAASDHDAILIVDEVQTSRLGWMGLARKLGITPDVITLGKYLGGGAPIGIVGSINGSRHGAEALAVFETTPHSGTFNNNALTMAAGIAAADVLSPQRLAAVNHLGDELRHAVEELLTTRLGAHARCMGMRGLGSLNNFWFANDEVRMLWWFWAVSKGMYVSPRGFLALTLEHTKVETDQLVEVVAGFVDQYEHILQSVQGNTFHGELVKAIEARIG